MEPRALMRPCVGLSPTTPQQAAGMRSEPPVSEPRAPWTMPAATATAAPLDEPPATRRGSQGFRQCPKVALCPVGPRANSDMLSAPSVIDPARSSRRTQSEVAFGVMDC